MSRRSGRWPIWKIAVATVGCALLCPAFYWLSMLADTSVGQDDAAPSTPAPMYTLSSLIVTLSVGSAIFAVLGVIWLVARIRDARTPTWKKKLKKRRF